MRAAVWPWVVLLAIVTGLVWTGALKGIDELTLDAFRAIQIPGLDAASSFIGLFGQVAVAGGIALGMAVARFRRAPRSALAPLLIVVVIVIESGLKMLVPQAPPAPERARSVEIIPLLQSPFAYAFPSGNVARVAFLLRIANGIPAWVVAAGVIAMVLTRLYLGEHWLSDTIGGALLGIGVANVARRLT